MFLGYEEYNDHYCGPRGEKPREEFNPILDVKQGDFIMVYPDNIDIYLVWLAMVESEIDNNPTSPNYKKLLIQYWAPCARKNGMIDVEVYANCWKGYWAKNVANQRVWKDVDAVVWSWRPRNPGPYARIEIPKRDVLKAQACLHLTVVHEHDGNELHDVYSSEE